VDDFTRRCLDLIDDLPIPTPYNDADFIDALTHLLGHLLLRHEPHPSTIDIPDGTVEYLARSLPGMTSNLIRRQLSRPGYDTQQERDAAAFATLLQAELSRRRIL
jgi:hypothetical protein